MPNSPLLNAHPKDYHFEPAQADQLRMEQGAYGERFRSPVAPQQQALVSTAIEQVCRPTILLEIIFYSKIHLVTPDEFVLKAKDYHKILRDESLLLYNDIKDNRKIYQEWADPDGFIESAVANTTAGFAAATDAVVGLFKAVKRAPKPDINEFDKLIERCTKVAYDVSAAASALHYENIHSLGINLALIREDSRRLYKAVDLFRNRAIDSAETITKGLETAEGASFQVLALVPTLTGMDPLREAAYRISLIVLRAGGRSAGAALAETSIIRELCGVLKADVPPMLVEVISSVLRGAIPKGAGKEFLIFIVKQEVEFLCDLALLVNQKGTQLNEEDLKQLGMNRLTSCLSELLSKVLGGRPSDTGVQRIAKSLAESTINTLWRDILAARETAKTQGREFWDVFLAELPWTIVKIIQGTFVGALQRNASRIAFEPHSEDGQQKALDVMKAQKASSIFTGQRVTQPSRSNAPKRAPLGPMSLAEYRQWQQDLCLHPDIAGQLRRYAHDSEQYVAFRVPSDAMAAHAAEFSKRPKPLWVKAKSATLGPTEGLVTKPTKERPIREDNDKAIATWEKSIDSIKKNGALVREDGVLFHPDMLRDAGKMDKANAAIYERAAQILTEFQAKGHYDLTDPNTVLALQHAYPNEAGALRQILQQARVGYYPDLDLAEVFDANTGDRIPVGAGNEKDAAELAYLQRNRSNLDEVVNINDDVRNLPPEARGPDGKPRVSLDNKSPHVQSLFQHGADNEYYRGGEGGPIAVVGPDGRKWRYPDRASFEAGMRITLGQKYQDPGQRNVRGILMTKNSKDDPTSGAMAKGSGERIDTVKFNRIRWYYERVRQDSDGGGTEVAMNDICMSLYQRGLSIKAEVFALAQGGRWRDLHSILQQHGTFAAMDRDGKNLVIAGATPESFANGLARLARTAVDLGAMFVPGLTVWFELYSSYKPVTSDFILNRIGGRETGVTSAVEDVSSAVPSFKPKPGSKMYAFCLDGFHASYSPPPPPPLPESTANLSAEERNRLYREHTVGSFGLNPPGFGKVEGQKLMAVWDDLTTRKLTYDEVKILGCPVSVFTAGLAACPGNVEPMEIPDLIQRQERPAMLVS
ncbi:MAG: hypothetical protein NTV52_24100 [Acidobacteria bacterium]|nr:hypothetical protein [Acidobacteriota bacterium]